MSETFDNGAQAAFDALSARGLMLATVESCTGGLVAGAITDIPGSSKVLDRGFVTYSNAAKTEMVGVPMALIEEHGAVSPEVAKAMATGALNHSAADITVAITGIAGPGGSDFKPEGLVCFHAASRTGEALARTHRFGPQGRAKIRALSVAEAFQIVLLLLKRV